MAAARHISPGQLAMLYPAGDLVDPEKYHHIDVEYGFGGTEGRYERTRDTKLSEARTGAAGNARVRTIGPGAETFYENIKREGVKEPVELYHPAPPHYEKPMLGQGHHRVFTSADIDPKREIPVKWLEG